MKRQVPDHEILALNSDPYNRDLRAAVLVKAILLQSTLRADILELWAIQR